MADDLRLQITTTATVSGSTVLVPVTTGNYYLRVTPFSSNTYTGTHVANGSWSFGTVQDGVYQLWNASAQVASFGEKYICDNEPDLKNVYVIAGGKLYVDAIEERTSAGGVTIDGVKLQDSAVYTNTIYAKTSTSGVTADGVLLKDGGITTTSQITTVNGTDDFHCATVVQLNDAIAGINVTPFQESPNKVRVIVGGTQEAGKVYITCKTAISYFASPAITKQCLVEISGTGVVSQNITLSHADLVSYVHLTGKKHINLILGTTGATTTKTITISGMTLYFGNGDITGARTYNGLTFENCDIYAFNSLTFTNCRLINCNIYQGSSHAITVTGTTEMIGCIAMQTITKNLTTGFVANTSDGIQTSYSMPTDPTVGS
jgi:hypothetical protein